MERNMAKVKSHGQVETITKENPTIDIPTSQVWNNVCVNMTMATTSVNTAIDIITPSMINATLCVNIVIASTSNHN